LIRLLLHHELLAALLRIKRRVKGVQLRFIVLHHSFLLFLGQPFDFGFLSGALTALLQPHADI
jgi:hypothetical protein